MCLFTTPENTFHNLTDSSTLSKIPTAHHLQSTTRHLRFLCSSLDSLAHGLAGIIIDIDAPE
jgi:hypothetical protein